MSLRPVFRCARPIKLFEKPKPFTDRLAQRTGVGPNTRQPLLCIVRAGGRNPAHGANHASQLMGGFKMLGQLPEATAHVAVLVSSRHKAATSAISVAR